MVDYLLAIIELSSLALTSVAIQEKLSSKSAFWRKWVTLWQNVMLKGFLEKSQWLRGGLANGSNTCLEVRRLVWFLRRRRRAEWRWKNRSAVRGSFQLEWTSEDLEGLPTYLHRSEFLPTWNRDMLHILSRNIKTWPQLFAVMGSS